MATPPPPTTKLSADDKITAYGLMAEAAGRLHQVFMASIEEGCDLPGPFFVVLLRLGRSPDQRLTMSELARQLSITSGGATRLIDRARAAGLVARTPCPDDRRVSWVELTDQGRAALDQALAIHLDDLDREFIGRLDAADLASLGRIMNVLRQPAPEGS